MQLQSVRIILVGTTHPGNIGSTARAMKTMGLQKLYLVSPKSFPDKQAYDLSAGAYDILDNAIVVDNLKEALDSCQLVFAMSARPRHLSLPGFTPSECATFLTTLEDETQVAFLFGREHAGLTNEELLHSHYHVQIPSNPAFSSLNLAQSVQVMAYEIRTKLLTSSAIVTMQQEELASSAEIERFYVHLAQVLKAIGFLKKDPGRVEHRLRRLFNRVKLELTEVKMLRGMLTRIERLLK